MTYCTDKMRSEIREHFKLYGFGKGDIKKIIELAKIFQIKIDESRLNDYTITRLECLLNWRTAPTITIYDKENKVEITSKITSMPSIGNCQSGEYIEIYTKTKSGILTKTFYPYNDKPLAEQLEITFGDNSIVFNRNDWKQMYDRSPYDREFYTYYYGKDRLYDFLFFNKYLDKKQGDQYYYFEQSACQEGRARDNNYDCPDNYIYCDDNNLIYAIKSEYNTIDCTAYGIFIEKNRNLCKDKNRLKEVCPNEINYKKFPAINFPEVESYLLYIPHYGSKKEKTHFEIYKTNEKIIINCKYLLRDNNEGWITTQEENIELPIMNIGPITGEEVRSVTNVLQSKCDGNIRKILCDDFLTYADMLDDRSKSLTEYDMLSSKKLFNTSFEDILEEIGNNKEEYFALADKQFREMAYGDKKNAPARVLKQDNN